MNRNQTNTKPARKCFLRTERKLMLSPIASGLMLRILQMAVFPTSTFSIVLLCMAGWSQPLAGAEQPGGDRVAASVPFESLRRDAEAGDPWAMYFYGRLHMSKKLGQTAAQVPPASVYPPEARSAWERNVAALGGADFGASYDEALKWYRKAAAKGVPAAMTNLGYMHLHGVGVKKDVKEALGWYNKGAAAGEPNAMNSVGATYLNGMRGGRDYDKAVGWFRRAADIGLPEAQNNMGVCYDNGWGVKTDPAEAVRWYRKAAAQDHAGAMRALGEHYSEGSGVAKDERAAVEWFKKAVAQEDAAAMRLLGQYYLSGKFVPEDKAKGLELFARATRTGDAEAFGFLLFCETRGDKDAAAHVAAIRRDEVRVDEKAAQAYTKKQMQSIEALEQRAKELEDKTEAQKKAAESIEKRLANAGGKPRFASAKEWDAAYRGAPYLTPSEFLKKVKAVRLSIIRSTVLLDLATDAQTRALVEKQLERKGLRVDPASPVEFRITLDLYKSTATARSTKHGKTSRDNHVLVTLFEFRVPARVYRGREFHHLVIAPISYLALATAGDSYTRRDVERDTAALFDFAWKGLQEPNQKRINDKAWQESLWVPARAADMYQKYLNSTAKRKEDLERVVAGVTGIARVEHDFTAQLRNADRWAGKPFITDAVVEREWRGALPTADLRLADDDGGMIVRHDTFAWGRGPTDMREALFYSDLEMFYALVSGIRLMQNDVVYELGPELYRGDVTLLSRENSRISFLDEARDELPALVREHVRDFVKELRFRR